MSGQARFTRKGGQRIRRVVERVEGIPDSTARAVADRAKYPILSPGGGGRLGITKAGGIPARSRSGWNITPGAGKVYLGSDNGGGLWVVDPGVEYDAFNSQNFTIPGDTVVQLKLIDGKLFVDVADC